MFSFLNHLFKLQFLVIILAVILDIYYPKILERFNYGQAEEYAAEASTTRFVVNDAHDTMFTKAELAKYNGEKDAPLYLALLGAVYDVTKGVKHYGSGCAYNFFVGRDASISFVTGEFDYFDEKKADDVLELKPKDLLGLANWKEFYNKDYIYKGKLIGRFYDSNGEKTAYHYKYLSLVKEAEKQKQTEDQLRNIYPDCNIEWSQLTGTRVWCTMTSGGIQRDWKGHPRKLYEFGIDAHRCACIRKEELDLKTILIEPYDTCDLLDHECFYHVA